MQAAPVAAEAAEEETVHDVEKHALAGDAKPDVEHLPGALCYMHSTSQQLIFLHLL